MTQIEKRFAVMTWAEDKEGKPVLLYWLNRNSDSSKLIGDPILACTINSENLPRDAASTIVIDHISSTIGRERAAKVVLQVEQFRSIGLPFLDDNNQQVKRTVPILFVKVQPSILEEIKDIEELVNKDRYSILDDSITRRTEEAFGDFAVERVGIQRI